MCTRMFQVSKRAPTDLTHDCMNGPIESPGWILFECETAVGCGLIRPSCECLIWCSRSLLLLWDERKGNQTAS